MTQDTQIIEAASSTGTDSASKNKGLAKIDYATCDEPTRAQLDAIIARYDLNDPQSLATYGSEIFEARQKRLATLQQTMRRASDLDPAEIMVQCAEAIEKELPTLRLAVQKTIHFAQRHPVETGVTTIATLLGGYVIAAAGAAVGLIREKNRLDKEKEQGPDMSTSEIRRRISTLRDEFTQHAQRLQWAEDNAPQIIAATRKAAHDNRDEYNAADIALAAGQEMLRRIQEKNATPQGDDFDAAFAKMAAQDNITTLGKNIRLLDQIRRGTVTDTQDLFNIMRAMQQTQENVEIMLQQGLPDALQATNAAERALDAFDVANSVREFQKRTQQAKTDATVIGQRAVEASFAGQIDSPENLAAELERVEQHVKWARTLNASLETRAGTQQEFLEKIEKSMRDLVQTGTSWTGAQLPPPQA